MSTASTGTSSNVKRPCRAIRGSFRNDNVQTRLQSCAPIEATHAAANTVDVGVGLED